MATGDFNNDSYDDLAIGVPNDYKPPSTEPSYWAGCVNIFTALYLGVLSVMIISARYDLGYRANISDNSKSDLSVAARAERKEGGNLAQGKVRVMDVHTRASHEVPAFLRGIFDSGVPHYWDH